jgi:tetratricopeptide (TPR) repeat protein
VSQEKQDFAAATAYFERALAIYEKIAPDSQYVAATLAQLARLELDRNGDLDRAEAHLRRALALYEALAPKPELAGVQQGMAELEERRGRLDAALALSREGLAIRQRLAPGSRELAKGIHLLGRLENRLGRTEEAAEHLCQAVEVIDRQRARIGPSPDARTAFESSIGTLYLGCLDARLRRGKRPRRSRSSSEPRASLPLPSFGAGLRPADLSPELASRRRRVRALRPGAGEASRPPTGA